MNEAQTGYLFLYEGRFARAARLLAIAVIAGTAFIGTPHPGWRGDGLVILISLVIAVGAQLAATVAPTPSAGRAMARATLGALAAAALIGFDSQVGTAVLLLFAGLDVANSFEFTPGAVVVGLAIVATAIGVLISGEPTSDISQGSVVIVGFLAGAGRRQYVLRADEAEMRLADAERAREEHARAAALAERANAAREIHDILAHSLGALVLQLDALDSVLHAETPDGARADELLARARALAVEGLSEAKQAVGTLRTDTPPLIDGLRQLVEAGGCGGSLEITGTPRAISAQGAVALRRAAQEGLTNAAKHAPGSVPQVRLAFLPTEVVLTVTDSGGAHNGATGALAHTGGGYGIEGLRERAELLGGTLTAGPRGAGWQVTLRVPDDRAGRARETP